jgi:signal transduction histidine kinase
MADLLSETVGRHINTHVDLEPDLPQPVVDRNQLENAIINLVINARDAMERGGDLTIATRRAGEDMIELSVSDTGMGMDPATLEHAAEPFFTTKPPGKGSGLGLSQVLGTVEQLGGRVQIDTEPGVGTTVRLFLPLA